MSTTPPASSPATDADEIAELDRRGRALGRDDPEDRRLPGGAVGAASASAHLLDGRVPHVAAARAVHRRRCRHHDHAGGRVRHPSTPRRTSDRHRRGPRRGHGRPGRARPLPAHAHLRRAAGAVRPGRGLRALGHARASEYLDFLSGLAVTGLGHAHPEVADALAEQARTLLHVSNLFGTEPGAEVGHGARPAAAAAAARCSSPTRGPRPTSAPSSWPASGAGTAATRSSPPTGRSTAAPSPPSHATGQPAKWEAFQPLPEGFRHVAWNDLDALEAALDPTVAAVMLEPVQGEGGVNPATADVLRGRAAAVRRAGPAVHGRRGPDRASAGPASGSASSTSAWSPTWSPWPRRSATASRSGPAGPGGDVAAAFEPGDHATTYGGQPLAAAAARAVLAVMERENVPQRAEHAGQPAAPRARAASRVSGRSGAWACCSPPSSSRGLDARAVAADLLDAGLVVNAVSPTALRLAPPLLVSDRRDRPGRRAPRRGAGRRPGEATHEAPARDRRPLRRGAADRCSASPPRRRCPAPSRARASPCCSRSPPPAPATRWRWRWCSSAATRSPSAPTRSASTPGRASRTSPAPCAATTPPSAPASSSTPSSSGWWRSSTVPVVNMLSDDAHPLQALADVLTLAHEHGGRRRPRRPHDRLRR